jgi:hypothetical protein
LLWTKQQIILRHACPGHLNKQEPLSFTVLRILSKIQVSTDCCWSWWWGEIMSLNCGHQRACFSSPTWHMSMGSHGGMILTGENWRTRRKKCPRATLPTKNPTWTDPVFRGEKFYIGEFYEKLSTNFSFCLPRTILTVTSHKSTPNVIVERLTLMLRIRRVPGLNLGPDTGYADRGLRSFPQFLQANGGIVPQN